MLLLYPVANCNSNFTVHCFNLVLIYKILFQFSVLLIRGVKSQSRLVSQDSMLNSKFCLYVQFNNHGLWSHWERPSKVLGVEPKQKWQAKQPVIRYQMR